MVKFYVSEYICYIDRREIIIIIGVYTIIKGKIK